MYKFLTDEIDNDDIVEDSEIDFVAIGDNHVENIIWLRENAGSRKFEIHHPENKKFQICLIETSSDKIYTVMINSVSKEVKNFRNIDFPLDIKSGPALIALSLRDSSGKAVAPAVLFEYDSNGKLVDCVLPENQIYYIHDDPFSPCYIIRNGEIITLPINPSQYLKLMDILEISTENDNSDDDDDDDFEEDAGMEKFTLHNKWF